MDVNKSNKVADIQADDEGIEMVSDSNAKIETTDKPDFLKVESKLKDTK